MTPRELVDMLLGLDPLADVPRTGWLLRGVASPESVAAHSHAVALTAMAIVDALREEGQDVDGERVLRIALLHDAAEAATGDIPGPVKTPAVKAALTVAEDGILDGLLVPKYAALARASRGDSLEAQIVRAADKVQMMAKALAYERCGRGRLEEFWDKDRHSSFAFVDAVHLELRQRRAQGSE